MKKFNEFPLSPSLLRAVEELGYTTPSPIQAETLPLLLGRDTDFLGLAATGTGKTAAFALPLLERIPEGARGVQALILCPTRELAIQVSGQIDLLGKYKNIRSLPIYGGAGYGDQIRGLKSGATIVVGTPGRVVDHMEKGTLDLKGLRTLVLDEADEMISMGFKEDLEFVLGRVPEGQANIWLFSATMGREVRHVADEYLKNPEKVQVNRTEMLPDTVEQLYYMIHEYDKPDLLRKVIDTAEDFYGIIFCQTKSLVVDVTQFLTQNGYKADCLHGDMNQEGRDRVMRAFRDKKLSVLVATDVACRGLDVKDITHVVNYSIPRELDNYVHRIGRTGRSGKSGIAVSFVTKSHRLLIGRIEQMTKSRMKEGKLPSLKDIAVRKVAKAQVRFTENGPQGRMTELLGEDWQTAIAPLSKEEIVGRFITLLHPELAGGKEPAKLADTRPFSEERDSRPAPVTERPAKSYSSPAPREKGGYEKRTFEKRPFPKKEFEKRGYPKKESEKATPPWERKTGPAKTFRPYGKKSTPWGAPAEGGLARPAKKWSDKKPFSAKSASEGKSKKWESRPPKGRHET